MSSNSTKFEIGDKILGSKKYADFMKIHPKNINEITTSELIELAVMAECYRVLIIDFSCDVCKDYFTDKVVPRNVVIQCRTQINNGKYGRGGKTKYIKSKNKKKHTKRRKTNNR